MLDMRAFSVIALLAFTLGPAFAQETAPENAPQEAPAENTPAAPQEPEFSEEQLRAKALAAREAAELRVERDMVKMKNLVDAMARNLGQLHYLRTLCFGDEDQKWRELANTMMNLESGADSARRRQLVKAFNSGYYIEESRFETCSEGVAVDAAALAENGRHIASMLGDPYRER